MTSESEKVYLETSNEVKECDTRLVQMETLNEVEQYDTRLVQMATLNAVEDCDTRLVHLEALNDTDEVERPSDMRGRKSMIKMPKLIGSAMTFASSVSKFTLSRKCTISGTATIDPMTWPGISQFKCWPGILAILMSYAIAPLITSLFFIGVGWRDYRTNEHRWWQCGVYCSALWLTAIQIFGFNLIQIKVRENNNHDFFVPSKLKGLLIYISSAIFAMLVWIFCYVSYGNKLLNPLGQSYAVAFAGIFGTSLLQTKFLVPEDVPKKDLFCLVLFGGAAVPIGLLISLACLVFYQWGDSVYLLAVFPFCRTIIDLLMRKMTSFTKSDFLECIFIHISSLCNNIFLIYSISGQASSGVIFAWLMSSGLMLYYYIVLTMPLECQLGMDNIKEKCMALKEGREAVYPLMTSADKVEATKLRAKLIYMVILDMASQLILPWWLPLQLALILFYTPARTSIVLLGFSVTRASFIRRFNTALILNALDIINMLVLTYFIRRKYPLFNPLRILHMMFEKFGILPIAGIMFILISIICFFIRDCGMDPIEVQALFY